MFPVLLRWTPVCWAALGCWTRPLSSAALRPTRFLRCSQRPRAPRITWSSPASSGPPTATSSSWPTTARSTASWFKPEPNLQLSPRCCIWQTWTCFRVFAQRQVLKCCSLDSLYLVGASNMYPELLSPTVDRVTWGSFKGLSEETKSHMKDLKVSNCDLARRVNTQLRSRFGLDGFFLNLP